MTCSLVGCTRCGVRNGIPGASRRICEHPGHCDTVIAMLHCALLVLLLVIPGVPLRAQEDWLPPAAAQGLAEQIVAKMHEIEPTIDKARLQAGGARLVAALRARLESWGEKEVLARAPKFPKLALPASKNQYLDAINRYQVCNLILVTQQDAMQPAEMRRNGVVGSAAITAAAIYLRKPFVDGGGTVGDIEAFLTSPAMDKAFEKMQTTPDLADYAAEQCTAVVNDLLIPQP